MPKKEIWTKGCREQGKFEKHCKKAKRNKLWGSLYLRIDRLFHKSDERKNLTKIWIFVLETSKSAINMWTCCQFHQHFTREAFLYWDLGLLLWRKNIGAKAAHNMLVKLTPGRCFVQDKKSCSALFYQKYLDFYIESRKFSALENYIENNMQIIHYVGSVIIVRYFVLKF